MVARIVITRKFVFCRFILYYFWKYIFIDRIYYSDSTYLPGLLKILNLVAVSNKIRTIIPGRLYTAHSNLQSNIELRLTTTIINGKLQDNNESNNSHLCINNDNMNSNSVTQKVLVRKKSNIQEVIYMYNFNEDVFWYLIYFIYIVIEYYIYISNIIFNFVIYIVVFTLSYRNIWYKTNVSWSFKIIG